MALIDDVLHRASLSDTQKAAEDRSNRRTALCIMAFAAAVGAGEVYGIVHAPAKIEQHSAKPNAYEAVGPSCQPPL